MVGATLLAVVCVAAELVGAAPRDEFVERWLDPALRAPLVLNISLLAPRNNHRAGTGDVFVMPTLDAGAGFPRGSASRWCVGVVSRDGWQVPCHAPGPLDAGKGIWLHDMPPGAYELWVFLVEGTAADANAVGVRADGGSGPVGERLLAAFPRATAGVRVQVLDERRVTEDYHIWYVDNVGMPGLGHPTFLGVPVQKSLNDLWTTQEILHELRPGFIVEFGSLRGGSALYYANTMRAIAAAAALEIVAPSPSPSPSPTPPPHLAQPASPCRILSVDINRAQIHPTALRDPDIEFLTASSVSPAAEEAARKLLLAARPAAPAPAPAALVLLDSVHTMAHVLRELEIVAPLMREGDYLIVEDTHHNGHPIAYSDDTGRPGPYEAVEAFERAHPGWFSHDTARETKFGFTWNPRGFMRRTAVGAT